MSPLAMTGHRFYGLHCTLYLGHLADMQIVSMTSIIIQLGMLHCEF